MPNIKSAKKRVITTKKRTEANVSKKSALKTYIKKARVAIDNKDPNANDAVRIASIKIDKAAAKGLIHKNTAARKKSKLSKALNASVNQ